MEHRQLGTSDLKLSVIGFGAWALGGGNWAFGWGPQDDNESIKAIHQAIDLGINWIDTAAVYGLGHAEEVVARALADRRGQMLIATKCGLRWRPNGKVYGELRAASVREEVENSLRRLRVETIDLYQIHWPNPEPLIEEAWDMMTRLTSEGKVRYIGVSNFNVEQMQRVAKIAPLTSLQPPYSLLNREVEGSILPHCAQQNIGVIAYSPLQCGLLTGAFNAERLANLPKEDWRKYDRFFKEPLFSRALRIVEKLRAMAARRECTVGQLALAWVLGHQTITAAIVGARRPAQISETALAGDLKLTPAEIAEIEDISTSAN